jgi:hypothetical protein
MIIIVMAVIMAVFLSHCTGSQPLCQPDDISKSKGKNLVSPGIPADPQAAPAAGCILVHRLFSGDDDRYDWTPVVSGQQKGDSPIVQQYIDRGISERHAFACSR